MARTVQVQTQLGNPTDRNFKHIVSVNSLKNALHNPSTSLMLHISLVH